MGIEPKTRGPREGGSERGERAAPAALHAVSESHDRPAVLAYLLPPSKEQVSLPPPPISVHKMFKNYPLILLLVSDSFFFLLGVAGALILEREFSDKIRTRSKLSTTSLRACGNRSGMRCGVSRLTRAYLVRNNNNKHMHLSLHNTREAKAIRPFSHTHSLSNVPMNAAI